MTYYPDLAPYAYLPATVPAGVTARTVGWLDGSHPFAQGPAPAGFARRLGLLCRDQPRARTRGIHRCGLAGLGGCGLEPVHVEIEGRQVLLGSAEVRVAGVDGAWLIAPTLVYHYVTAHAYLPPAAFVEAVTAARVVG
ncbi:hypothetical protein [Streptomyces hainanensis]|uniref:DUF7919 domain-containing protein n=1 Tax=Streptomyces hainanensis TaxID=402648 RepID=A0A4R4THZ0_9ACTN|nr:hypothetical protein [Streptomyces hainanensis]TDC73969.1 hypothetical protein E1283_17460 [Streptomyces hainanensis]